MAETVQERLYQAFISRRYGLLSDDTLLVMLGCILRGAPRNLPMFGSEVARICAS